jgi:hypothetical protein
VKALLIFVLTFFVSFFSYSQEQKSLECIDRTFSVVVHIAKDTFGTTNFDLTKLTSSMEYLNASFAPICVNFEICDIRYINNFNFDDWDITKNGYESICLFSEPKHINIFFVQKTTTPEGNGYASQEGISSSSGNIVVLNKNFLVSNLLHYIGHYFGLLDTFEAGENVDGSNCISAGDKICDTPADVQFGFSGTNCEYNLSYKDANNQYYKPLVENFMSNYGACRKSFTQQQYELMINKIKSNPTTHF